MTRFILAASAALALAALPAIAQTTPPQKPTASTAVPQATSQADPAPGSEAWLRMRGESYSAAPDSAQDPAELEATAKLNAAIAARNAAAEQAEAENARAAEAYEADNARWREENARINTARAQWEADQAAADAARARWERERAAWEAEVAACERAGRRPCAPAPARY